MNMNSADTALATQRKWSARAFWISTILALLSIAWAICHRLQTCKCVWSYKSPTGDDWPSKIVILFWVALPPLWFFFEWIILCPNLLKDERERIAHTHDLARNVWLALVVFLAVILGVKDFTGGHSADRGP
jgi:hypothetical protein